MDDADQKLVFDDFQAAIFFESRLDKELEPRQVVRKMRKLPRKPLQQKPVSPTSYHSSPFSEQTFAFAHSGGQIGIKNLTQNPENSHEIGILQFTLNHYTIISA
jgi:hypothetical protein